MFFEFFKNSVRIYRNNNLGTQIEIKEGKKKCGVGREIFHF
jgi:hypothetical protein